MPTPWQNGSVEGNRSELTLLARIEVKEAKATMTHGYLEPPWEVVVDYGAFSEHADQLEQQLIDAFPFVLNAQRNKFSPQERRYAD